MKIFLDDLRDPVDWGHWNVIARSYNDFGQALDKCIRDDDKVIEIAFDHDLGEGKTGMDCVKLLIEMDIDHGILSSRFAFTIHSANPVGRKNMSDLLMNYMMMKEK
jgi:hypothetical protein